MMGEMAEGDTIFRGLGCGKLRLPGTPPPGPTGRS